MGSLSKWIFLFLKKPPCPWRRSIPMVMLQGPSAVLSSPLILLLKVLTALINLQIGQQLWICWLRTVWDHNFCKMYTFVYIVVRETQPNTILAIFKHTALWHYVCSYCCAVSTPSISRTFLSSQTKSLSPLNNDPHSPLFPQPLATSILLSVSVRYLM